MSGFQALGRRFDYPLVPHQRVGLVAINMCGRCGGLSMVLLQLKDSLDLFIKRREFYPGSGFLSRSDMT